MEIDILCRTEWAGGQLLAFSGLDGPTDFEHGLTARTATDGPYHQVFHDYGWTATLYVDMVFSRSHLWRRATETFGKVHPSHRHYAQWDQMEEGK